ncbi:beta strand repeat-containing protein [Chryseobacterium sp. MMS23-Vi53]|uniref:beta strand repeat-containing protein n=1 Tax=Chryseobacterium sp. MMS23-Vi53 TaxID=3386644 RepID=UPI0039E8029F
MTFVFIGVFGISIAQVGINTANPVSTLDIIAKNATGNSTNVDGITIPRVDRARAQAMASIPLSTMIYINDISTGTNSGTTIDVTSVGFYYFDGIKWVAIITTPSNNDWRTTGNTGTTPGTNFIGTTDNQNVVFKRNNNDAGVLSNINTSFGEDSLPSASPALLSSAFGVGALSAATAGSVANSAFGNQSLSANTTGVQNASFGFQALQNNTTGSRITALGSGSLRSQTSGGDNVAVGYNSLDVLTGASAFNVAVGADALGTLTAGSGNTAIGDNTGNPSSGGGGVSFTTGSNNILIGVNSTFLNATTNNQMNIGNALFGTNLSNDIANLTANIGIGTATPATRLHVLATTANANRYNLFDAAAGTNQYGIIALRNTSALATGNYSLLGFTNSGPTSGGANWAIGSIRTGATATNGSEEDFYIGNSTGGALNERLRIKPNTGNVGIGTSNPTARLEIASGTTDVSGLKFTNINSTTPPTANTSSLGIDASGNVVVQSSLTTSFKSFNIDASVAANSLVTLGGIQLRYPSTTCTSTGTFLQIRSTTGSNNAGIIHAATISSQTTASNTFVATVPFTITTGFADITSLPVNCVQDGHTQFSFFSYTDKTFYRINFNVADGDSISGVVPQGYIFAELQK